MEARCIDAFRRKANGHALQLLFQKVIILEKILHRFHVIQSWFWGWSMMRWLLFFLHRQRGWGWGWWGLKLRLL